MRTLSTYLLALSCTAAAHADTLYLQNGDRVSGHLLEMDAGAATILTGYAGAVTIVRDAIAALETDTARTLHLGDGGTVTGRLTVEDGEGALECPEGPRPLPLAQVAAVTRLEPDGDEPPPPGLEAVPEETGAPSPPRVWTGSVESSLALRSGNTDTTDFTLAAALRRERERHALDLKVSGAYGEADERINTRRMAGEARWQWYLTEPLYLYLLGGAERDDGRKLDVRLYTAAGLGYDIIAAGRRALSADAGLDYKWERWNPYTPAARDDARRGIRAAALAQLPDALAGLAAGGLSLAGLEQAGGLLRDVASPLRNADTRSNDDISLRLSATYTETLFKVSKLSENLVFYPNLTQTGEFRAVSELSFTTPLSEALLLKISLRTEYDSLAEESGVDPWDNTLLTGLRYEF